MADMKHIHEFAVKWYDKFRDKKINYIELIDHYMADDCEALGFVMDCGHAFSEKYGKAANDFEALERIISEITDIPLLGSAIYSQWRYFNHWAYSGEEILEPQNCAWFTIALSRLGELADFQLKRFKGTPQKYASFPITSAMVRPQNPMTKSNSISPSTLMGAYGFQHITLAPALTDTKNPEAKFIKLKRIPLPGC